MTSPRLVRLGECKEKRLETRVATANQSLYARLSQPARPPQPPSSPRVHAHHEINVLSETLRRREPNPSIEEVLVAIPNLLNLIP